MHIEMRSRPFNLPAQTREDLAERVERLALIGIGITDAAVHIEERGGRFDAELTLSGKRAVFRASASGAGSVSQAIDAAIAKAEKQLRRHKDRIRNARRRAVQPEPLEGGDIPPIVDSNS
ncbi:MAG: ribosome-associated translation inhibitor RaiA [Candidatus Poribacteria bacterium]|nr:ribosome-associated translation inhibitor RaiA [Candidatus Poribacteria bacterium]